MGLLPPQIAGLWDGSVLTLPRHYVAWYAEQVTNLGRTNDALSLTPPKHVIGGASQKDTEDHFVYRFPNSGGRVCFGFLDPNDELVEASSALQTSLVDGHVVLIDLPAGSGALSLGVLATLVQLRLDGVLPKLPLKVTVLAGDFSAPALKLAEAGAAMLVGPAAAVGIEIDYRPRLWDVTQPDDWTQHLDEVLAVDGVDNVLVGVLDFAGALKDKTLRDTFQDALKWNLGRLSDVKAASLVWLEPMTGQTGLLDRALSGAISKMRSWVSGTILRTSKYRLRHPLAGHDFGSDVELRSAKRR